MSNLYVFATNTLPELFCIICNIQQNYINIVDYTSCKIRESIKFYKVSAEIFTNKLTKKKQKIVSCEQGYYVASGSAFNFRNESYKNVATFKFYDMKENCTSAPELNSDTTDTTYTIFKMW